MTYKFKINNDYLSENGHFDGVTGNKNVYLCDFEIVCDEEGAIWFAVFKKDEDIYILPIVGGRCSFPYELLENAGTVYLGCYAECNGEKRISTNWIPLKIDKGAYSEGTAPQPPREDLWETLLGNSVPIIGENGNWFTYDMAEETYVDTGLTSRGERGLKGDKGDKGDTGEQGIQGIQGLKGDKGDKGDTGEAGYAPQKGIDYFTAADIAEIAQNFEPTATKQDILESGENIKTINGESILGSGNLETAENLELIERIVVGYAVTQSKPTDGSWFTENDTYISQDLNDSNFTPISNTFYYHTGTTNYQYPGQGIYYYNGTDFLAYFTNTGTAREPVYEILTQAKGWAEGMYYSYMPVTTTTGASGNIGRREEPDGTPYSFKELVFDIQSGNSGQTGGICTYLSGFPFDKMIANYYSIKPNEIYRVSHNGKIWRVDFSQTNVNIYDTSQNPRGKLLGMGCYNGTPFTQFSFYWNISCRGGVIIDVYGIRE